MKTWIKKHQHILTLGGIIILSVLILYLFSFTFDFRHGSEPKWGVTFSQKYAQELGLDWQQTYLEILDDLGVDAIRLVAYWDEIERRPDDYDFSDLDWQLAAAGDRGLDVVLVFGRRTPRWPECHDPLWLADLSESQQQAKLMAFVRAVVDRYRDMPQISAWQVENEPFLTVFGECPKPDGRLLAAEIAAVKTLDPRPVIVTDSGELSGWQKAAGYPDVFGTTLYRVVWNKYLGFWNYFFIPPAYYRLKADLAVLGHKNLQDVIITELQMEPWTFSGPMTGLTIAEQEKSFDLARFKSNIAYVEKIGFPRVYLWGVEYWYWLKSQGRPEIWETAKNLWR